MSMYVVISSKQKEKQHASQTVNVIARRQTRSFLTNFPRKPSTFHLSGPVPTRFRSVNNNIYTEISVTVTIIINYRVSTMTYIKPTVQEAKSRCNAAILTETLKSYPKQWKNFTLRAIFSTLLISYFCFTMYSGPILVILTTMFIQVKCFFEIMNVGYVTYKIPNNAWFIRLVPVYFLVVTNYFFFGEIMAEHISVFINKIELFRLLVLYHRFLSFCLYFFGLIIFIFTLVRNQDKQQYCILTWTHLALFVIVAQSYMVVKNVFQGMIWLVMSVTTVCCNDIMAFLVGKYLGRTPLTKLSPKKTWEGFIGGGIFTLVYTVAISYVLCGYQYFVCPSEYVLSPEGTIQLSTNCTPSALFTLKNYHLSFSVLNVLEVDTNLIMYPFIIDSVFMAMFSSLIAPFGGIFASGFKRAFKVKDFANTIPGHGGILDRFDCQYLMTTFVNVYISSFVTSASPEKILARVLYMKPNQQLQFFHMLESLIKERDFVVINATARL